MNTEREHHDAKHHLPAEIANAMTHGLGLLLSAVGVVVLVTLAVQRPSARYAVACAIYGATLIMLYLASTLYHSLSSTRARHVLRVIDHASIYLLIAGSYTPFLLLNLRGAWGWSLMGVIWGLAAAGIVFKILHTGRYRIVSAAIYLAMGWISVIAIRPLLQTVPLWGMVWLAAGGLFYTFGIVFFAWKSLKFGHAVWHLFVLAGSGCHFVAIMFYCLPAPAGSP